MKEHPILFQGAMVRAILNGLKTQTRRVCKPQPFDRSQSRRDHRMAYMSGRASDGDEMDGLVAYTTGGGGHWQQRCPYGQPGDRLWVRETFAKVDGNTRPLLANDYRATYQFGDALGDAIGGVKRRWTPSIHMPKTASRITLEVTDVRVERLNVCSEADALAEGITGPHYVGHSAFRLPDDSTPRYSSAMTAFEALWEQINGPGSWAANPWVWVIGFRRLDQ